MITHSYTNPDFSGDFQPAINRYFDFSRGHIAWCYKHGIAQCQACTAEALDAADCESIYRETVVMKTYNDTLEQLHKRDEAHRERMRAQRKSDRANSALDRLRLHDHTAFTQAQHYWREMTR